MKYRHFLNNKKMNNDINLIFVFLLPFVYACLRPYRSLYHKLVVVNMLLHLYNIDENRLLIYLEFLYVIIDRYYHLN